MRLSQHILCMRPFGGVPLLVASENDFRHFSLLPLLTPQQPNKQTSATHVLRDCIFLLFLPSLASAISLAFLERLKATIASSQMVIPSVTWFREPTNNEMLPNLVQSRRFINRVPRCQIRRKHGHYLSGRGPAPGPPAPGDTASLALCGPAQRVPWST